jgi:hypothetical protein
MVIAAGKSFSQLMLGCLRCSTVATLWFILVTGFEQPFLVLLLRQLM